MKETTLEMERSAAVIERHRVERELEIAKAKNAKLRAALEDARIALTFYRDWMREKKETRYPFGEDVEIAINTLLAEVTK